MVAPRDAPARSCCAATAVERLIGEAPLTGVAAISDVCPGPGCSAAVSGEGWPAWPPVSRTRIGSAVEQLVSQATKNIGLMEREPLTERLRERLADRDRHWSATWHNGVRSTAAGFLEALDRHRFDTRTHVVLVQPHLSATARTRAAAHIAAGRRTRNAYQLRLLDDLPNETRQSITGNCHDLTVIGCS